MGDIFRFPLIIVPYYWKISIHEDDWMHFIKILFVKKDENENNYSEEIQQWNISVKQLHQLLQWRHMINVHEIEYNVS